MTDQKAKVKRQDPIEVGKDVYFLGFTKNKATGNVDYLCRAVILESPSEFNKAPHKVKILAVALSKFDNNGNEDDGRCLLQKEIYIPLEKLNIELVDWLTPQKWWS